MRIELLVIDGCPQEPGARSLLRRAMDELGLEAADYDVVVVDSLADAEQRRFLGSPTFMLGGRDLFDQPGRPPALACRLYAAGQPLPTLRDLRQALKHAAAGQHDQA